MIYSGIFNKLFRVYQRYFSIFFPFLLSRAERGASLNLRSFSCSVWHFDLLWIFFDFVFSFLVRFQKSNA